VKPQDTIEPSLSRWGSTACLLCVLVMMTACTSFKPTPRQGPVAPLPKGYSLFPDKDVDPAKWWEAFGSDALNAMVEEAVAANFNVRVAWARLRQAGASATQSGASKYPTLTLNGGYDFNRKYASGARKKADTEKHSIGLQAGYEVDLWGRVAASAASGDLDYMASREDVNSAAMAVAGEVVTRWIEIQTQRKKKRILAEQIQSNATYLELIELRFRNSLATALDVYQQRECLHRRLRPAGAC